MGLRGPRPKPSVIEIMEGLPGRRPVNQREPKPIVREPDIPRHLSAPARKHWRRLVDSMMTCRILTEADGDALGALCQNLADRDELQIAIRKSGWLIKNPQTGAIHVNPLVPVEMAKSREIAAMLREFGRTPSSRTRVQTVDRDTATTEDLMFG